MHDIQTAPYKDFAVPANIWNISAYFIADLKKPYKPFWKDFIRFEYDRY